MKEISKNKNRKGKDVNKIKKIEGRIVKNKSSVEI